MDRKKLRVKLLSGDVPQEEKKFLWEKYSRILTAKDIGWIARNARDSIVCRLATERVYSLGHVPEGKKAFEALSGITSVTTNNIT